MVVEHPFFPRDLVVPNYVPQVWSRNEILALFFSLVLVLLGAVWVAISKRTTALAPRLNVVWFVLSGLIHVFVEGWFVLVNQSIAGRTDFMSDLWKECKGDRRTGRVH